MYRITLLLLSATLLWAKDLPCGNNVSTQCFKNCCKSLKVPEMNDSIKNCLELKEKAPCELEKCFADKLGFANADKSLNKESLSNHLDHWLANEPEFLTLIKKNCIAKDVSDYGEDDDCDHIKMRRCMNVQITKVCKDWDDEGDCKGVNDTAECIKKNYPQ